MVRKLRSGRQQSALEVADGADDADDDFEASWQLLVEIPPFSRYGLAG